MANEPKKSALDKLDMSIHLTEDQRATLAMQYLTELTAERYQFTNAQLDIAVGLPMRLLPPNDVETLKDVARNNGVPLWQAIYAQFRRANEQGFAYALMLDPGWIAEEHVRLVERECPECNQKFMPANDGQKFCSSACGAAKERSSFEAKRSQAQVEEPKVETPVIFEDYGPFAHKDKDDGEGPGIIPFGVEVLANTIRSA